jgi:hypothetical protein
MSGSIKFFDYNMRSKDRNVEDSEQLKRYEHIYKNAFCKAFGIECTEMELRGFLYLIKKRILDRHNPEGVDYRPIGSAFRLYVTPLRGSTKLGICSYKDTNYDKQFDTFKKLLSGKTSEKKNDLENIIS